MTIQEQIAQTAAVYGVDPSLALKVAQNESGLNPAARSPAGAVGVFQLMPATAAMLGVDPANVTENITGGIKYLASLISQYGGDIAKALAAYNWGPSNVNRAVAASGGDWAGSLPSETSAYLSSILGPAALTPTPVGIDATGNSVDASGNIIDLTGSSGMSDALYVGGALLLILLFVWLVKR